MLMRSILLSALISLPALARETYKESSREGTNSVGADASVEAGGLAVGADYEYAIKPDIGLGGYFHYFPKSTRTTNPQNGYIMLGAEAAAHYVAGSIDAYVAPGLGFVNIDSVRPNVSDVFTVGPRFAIGVLYQINPTIAVGMEENSYWVWLDADYNGLVMNDLALRFRATF